MKPKTQTIEEVLADALKSSEDFYAKDTQRIRNKIDSDFADAVRYSGFSFIEDPRKPIPLYKIWLLKIKYKITWPLGLRIVHEDNICNGEDC